jgi:uncharacterized phage protein gp47/JayE
VPLPSLYRTPEAYLADMIADIQAAGGQLTDYTQGSVTRTLLETWANRLSSQSLVLDQLQTDTFLATATGPALDEKAADYEVVRNAAVPATGTVRISRAQTGTALVIPAGWGQLQTAPAPGTPPRAFLTTDDAEFDTGDLFVDVSAVAVAGGQAGNILQGTVLLPVNPVAGFNIDGGFVAQTDFTGGVEAETDAALLRKTRKKVQGRGNANDVAFEAEALGVPGVESVQVLKAGDTRANASTVPAGECEIYYEGSASLLAQVQSACDAIAQLNQDATAFTATAEPCVAEVTVFALPGVDTAALAGISSDAIREVVNATETGGTAYMSDVVQALHRISDVISVDLPLGQLRKQSDAPGAGNITAAAGTFLTLAAADVTVTVTTL